MPHIPRNTAPSGQLGGAFDAPKAAPRKARARPSVPYKGSEKSNVESPRGSQFTSKLDMKSWDVDPMRILQQLLGKEMVADEHSGMVSDPERSS
jgi:hypothetical protein